MGEAASTPRSVSLGSSGPLLPRRSSASSAARAAMSLSMIPPNEMRPPRRRRAAARIGDRPSPPGRREHATAGRDHSTVAPAVPEWKTAASETAAAASSPSIAIPARAGPGTAAGEDDGHRGFVGRGRPSRPRADPGRKRPAPRPGRRGAADHDLCLRVAEPAVVLEDLEARRRSASGPCIGGRRTRSPPVGGRAPSRRRRPRSGPSPRRRATGAASSAHPPVFGPASPSPTRLESCAACQGHHDRRRRARTRTPRALEQLLDDDGGAADSPKTPSSRHASIALEPPRRRRRAPRPSQPRARRP